MHVDMIESSNSDLLQVALENTAVSLKSIIAKHESLATYENHLAGDLVNARKCVEMALVSLAALVSMMILIVLGKFFPALALLISSSTNLKLSSILTAVLVIQTELRFGD